MRGLKRGWPVLFLLLILMATGCGPSVQEAAPSPSGGDAPESAPAREDAREEEPCLAILEWVDFLMINDITYSRSYEASEPLPAGQLGEKVGEVSYMLNDHACTDHATKNGDAAYLPIGTEIYAVKGYKPEFRVAANNKVYQVNSNPHAETLGDLWDIEGKVERVGLDNGNDGSPIGDFSPEATERLASELLPLPYVGFDEVYERTKHEASVFLRIYLEDGTSFRTVYYPIANAFSAGAFGTKELGSLIMLERAQIKAAAGL